jgi:small-conductance mechanosensitive channel
MFQEIQSEIVSLISVGFGLIISLLIKDLITSFVYGLSFYIDRNFREGDNVIVDGEEARIIKIGLTRTIFKKLKTGNWLYVHNSRIRYLKIEKK